MRNRAPANAPGLQTTIDFNVCQRWHKRRDRYRPAGEVFDPRFAGVSEIDTATAKAYVIDHHYSASFPASRLAVGIFLREPFKPEVLCGVAVMSVPMNQAVIPAYFPGLAPNDGVELGRLVLADHLAAESWFIARVFKILRARLPTVRGVIAYCDPLPRTDARGVQAKPGHIGTIYRATNSHAAGRSRARTLLLLPDGTVANERSLSKIRNNEVGTNYVQRDLQRRGVDRREFGESGADWINRLIDGNFLRRIAHPGNLYFTWAL